LDCYIFESINRTLSAKNRFLLFLKLFGLMGIPWVFEIISWAVGGNDAYWYLPDAINILRSIFIFTTFCWKKKVSSAKICCQMNF